jgi:SNF2 family DNA or RNA helicase
MSSRIEALIDVFNRHHDEDPECSVIVFDESVYFLDIVQIAFRMTVDPIECLRYDGRSMPEIRPAILEDFAKSKGAKVLLMTRATGGLGLNITCANVVIQCSP